MKSEYNFNAYDMVVAIVLMQYLKERDYKRELGEVIHGSEISAPALAELLDCAAAWAKSQISTGSEPLTQGIIDLVNEALTDFSGLRYVQAMDVGFAEFLDDLLNDSV